MSKWTEWRGLKPKNFDWDGASCYELGIGKSKRKAVRVYVGSTKYEEGRLYDYFIRGSHLADHINKAKRNNFKVYFRAQAKITLNKAIKMEKKLLKERYYAWNTQIN